MDKEKFNELFGGMIDLTKDSQIDKEEALNRMWVAVNMIAQGHKQQAFDSLIGRFKREKDKSMFAKPDWVIAMLEMYKH